MPDRAPSCLILRLQGGGPGKTGIENDRLKPILGTEGVHLRQSCLRIERLHRTGGIFRRHERDGTARAEQRRETRDPPLRSRRCRQQHQHGYRGAPLQHRFPVARSAQHQTRRCRRYAGQNEPRIPIGARPDGVAAHLLSLMPRGQSCDGLPHPIRIAAGAHTLVLRRPTPCRRHRLLRRASWRGRGNATSR
jgi:hypothetical protein